jgi:hypothetical protein
MSEKDLNDRIGKHDLESILQVNRKAIEIQTDVAGQNEEIIDFLTISKERHDIFDKKLDVINQMCIDISEQIEESNNKSEKRDEDVKKQNEAISRELFQQKILFIGAFLGIIAQIISFIFLKK